MLGLREIYGLAFSTGFGEFQSPTSQRNSFWLPFRVVKRSAPASWLLWANSLSCSLARPRQGKLQQVVRRYICFALILVGDDACCLNCQLSGTDPLVGCCKDFLIAADAPARVLPLMLSPPRTREEKGPICPVAAFNLERDGLALLLGRGT